MNGSPAYIQARSVPPTECNYVHLHSKLEIRPAYCSITSAACDCVSVVIIALKTLIITYKYAQLSHMWANVMEICSGAPRKLFLQNQFRELDEGVKNHMKMRIIQAQIAGFDILTISSYWYNRKSKPDLIFVIFSPQVYFGLKFLHMTIFS